MSITKKKYSRTNIILSILLFVAIVIIILLLLRGCQPEVNPGGEKIETNEPVEKLEDSIVLPGYITLGMKANSKEQTLKLPNPPENTCLVRITLLLSDGTVLWQSRDIQPGYYSEPVVLNEPLAAGKYPDTVLKYECFTDDKEHRPLNGSESCFMLVVQ